MYRIIECVVRCCATQIDSDGRMSVTVEDVLGKSRAENVLMTRCILVGEMVGAGYSVTTAAQPATVTVPNPQGVLMPACVAWQYGMGGYGTGGFWS